MQSASGLTKRLVDLYAALHQHYGFEAHWWPIFGPDRRWEIVVGALLVQQSKWERVEAAILRLLAVDCYSPRQVAALTPGELAPLLAGVAFPRQKAPKLIGLAQHVLAAGGDVGRWLDQPTEQMRAELLRLPGVGPETADVILLYAGDHAVFVVDAYLRRLFARLAILPGAATMPYADLRTIIEQALPIDLDLRAYPHLQGQQRLFFWDYHALINEHCIHHCLARLPRCDGPSAPRRPFTLPEKCATHCPPCGGCPLRPGCAAYGKWGDGLRTKD